MPKDDAQFVADDGSLRHAIDYADSFLDQFRVDKRTPDILSAPGKLDGQQALLIVSTLVKRWKQENGEPAEVGVVRLARKNQT